MLQLHVSCKFNSMVQNKHVMPNNKREKSIHVLNTIQHGNRKASKYQFFWNGCQSLMTTKSHVWICQIQMCDFVCFWRWLPTTNKGGDCFQFDLFPRFGFWAMLSQTFWFFSYFNYEDCKPISCFHRWWWSSHERWWNKVEVPMVSEGLGYMIIILITIIIKPPHQCKKMT